MTRKQRQRLQFLVRFAQRDLRTLRPGDWLNLRDDLSRYVSDPDTFWVVSKDDPHWETTAEAVIASIQRTTRDILAHLAGAVATEHGALETYAQTYPEDHAPVQMLQTTGRTIALGPQEAQLLLATDTHTGKVKAHVRYLMGPSAAFLTKLSADVSGDAVDSLHRCPACATLFVGSGKQHYCSRTCVNRVASRRWREQGTNRERDNQRARDRYAKQVKGHTRVKVGRHGAP